MNPTIIDSIANHAASDRFVVEIETGQRVSLENLFKNAVSLSASLSDYDREVVTVILPNSIRFIEFFLACLMSDNIFNPIPYFTGMPEIKKTIAYTEPACIVSDRQDVVDRFRPSHRILNPEVSHISARGVGNKRFDPDSAVALFCLSSPSWDPKGVLYSYLNFSALITSVVEDFEFGPEDTHLAFLPFGHTAAINYNLLPALAAGSNLFISKGFEYLRTDFFSVLARYGITYTQTVPTILSLLMELDLDTSHCDMSRLRYIGCGSAPLPLKTQTGFMKQYEVSVSNLYGLTETGPTHVDDPHKPHWSPGSIGVPLKVNQCRIDTDGEICVRGKNVFIGYHNNSRLYNRSVRDGWFHTGDIGSEQNGRYFFSGLKKALIIKGGINIDPLEVEEVILKHHPVREVVVVGIENPLYGEDVAAVVVPKSQHQTEGLSDALRQLCRSELSDYKIPYRFIFQPELPGGDDDMGRRIQVRSTIDG